MRYIPHAVVTVLVLLLPLILSMLLAAMSFALYTVYIMYAFNLYAPAGMNLTIQEAADQALVDVFDLFNV